ncbi:GPW/gp25 family protein [Pantanalinema rosaneae CENA516]|uniref:GPW/gp25 family protein n=1 Tax=Pantanalinema rosaneae TaxID=1620701 RepID=UPI003D6EA167
MAKEFLGKGAGFPVRLDQDNHLQRADYEESVQQAVWIILGTAKGERVMRPEFGCDIHEQVFEMRTAATAGTIAHMVRLDLLQFEPRIDVLDVQVEPVSDFEGEKLLISIDYRVRSTNNVFNLVYPFYLERRLG